MSEIVISPESWEVHNVQVTISTSVGGLKEWGVEVTGPVVRGIPCDQQEHTFRYRTGQRSWWERVFSWPWRPLRGWREEYVGSVYVQSKQVGSDRRATLMGSGPLEKRSWDD